MALPIYTSIFRLLFSITDVVVLIALNIAIFICNLTRDKFLYLSKGEMDLRIHTTVLLERLLPTHILSL